MRTFFKRSRQSVRTGDGLEAVYRRCLVYTGLAALDGYSQVEGGLEFGVAGDFFGAVDAAAEEVGFEGGFFEAGDPALEAAFGTQGRFFFVFGGRGQEIDFAEAVVLGIHGVHPVDVVCWATPIYYYEMSGQMKTLIDRMNAMYEQDYAFRDVYLLTTAAEDEEETPKRAEIGLTGWIDCYPKSRLTGTLFCGGVNNAREIAGHSKLQEAYELGKTV